MIEEKEIVKIKTKKGRVITLTVQHKTETHYFGEDKYGQDIILSIEEIDELLPIMRDAFCD